MKKKMTSDVIGYSTQDISDALQNALSKLTHSAYEVVETKGVCIGNTNMQYEVTLAELEEYC